VLAARGSERRLVELAPTLDPAVVGGPQAKLLAAIAKGAIRPASPGS
jgi:hypothetical protein